MKTTIAQIDNEIIKLRQKQNRIHKQEEKELIPKFKKQWIGRCFKYRNSYGGDQKKWWLYSMVTDITGVNFCRTPASPHLNVISFQKCSMEEFRIKVKEFNYDMDSHIEIKPSEFNIEYKKILKELTLLTKGVKNDS